MRRRITGIAAALAAGGAVVATALAAAPAHAATTPTTTVQAEDWASASGARTQPTTDAGGGSNVGWLASADSTTYPAVDLGGGGALDLTLRWSSSVRQGGSVELHADRVDGALLATVPISFTGGWQTWTSTTVTTASAPSGRHALALVMRSAQSGDFVNLNWFRVGPHEGASTAPSTGASAPPSTGTGGTGSGSGGGMTGMPGMSTPPAGSWVGVDPAAQAEATAAFFARTPAPITGNPVRVSEFHATCHVSHHGKDDPIVFPGMPGASHDHTFFGNDSTSATSTLASLRASTTNCDPAQDRSAYWVPTLYASGKAVDPDEVTVYYGSRLKDPSRTQPFPAGFRMITGDPRVQTDTPDHQGNHFWCAGLGGTIGRSADGTMPVCGKDAHLVRQVTFADCWDGKHLDSPDHRSHVSDAVNGACPAAFPVAIPNISFVISYPASLDVQHVTLASGTTYSMHADFFNAWDDDALAARVRDCIDQHAKCDAAGRF